MEAAQTGDKSGTTATAVVVVGNTLACGNVGDSSAILAVGRGKEPVQLTFEHKASNEDEKKRVKAAGGLVVWFSGGWRVNGTMAVSRSIGDESMGSVLIPEPYVFEHTITEEDDFVVIATDGLWDVMTPIQVSDFVYEWKSKQQAMNENQSPTNSKDSTEEDYLDDSENNASIALVEEALRLNSSDNTSVLVLFLKENGKGHRRDRLTGQQDSSHSN